MEYKTKLIECSCKSNVFLINLDKTEAIAVLTCKKCNKNYFLLDSGDYWYDAIQGRKYPSLAKCLKCKNSYFKIGLLYELENNSKDLSNMVVAVGYCEKCNVLNNFGTWEIDYRPNDFLLKKPIIFVKNPKIKYSLIRYTCCWKKEDLLKFINFIFKEGLQIYNQYFENRKALIKKLGKKEALDLASGLNYYKFFISTTDLPNREINWKNNEIIEVNNPIYMVNNGKHVMTFSIECSNNYISDFKSGKVEEKSKKFKDTIKDIENWLKSNYVTLRGKGSFDNLEEHIKLFENQFIKNKQK